MKNKILILLVLILLVGCSKERDFYSSYYYVLSGKHVYLGMTKEEIETEIGPIIDITEYGLTTYQRTENISYKGTTLEVVNTFIMRDDLLIFHEYEISTNYQMAKSIIDKYITIEDINLFDQKDRYVLHYHTLPNNTFPTVSTRYKAPYLSITFSLE